MLGDKDAVANIAVKKPGYGENILRGHARPEED